MKCSLLKIFGCFFLLLIFGQTKAQQAERSNLEEEQLTYPKPFSSVSEIEKSNARKKANEVKFMKLEEDSKKMSKSGGSLEHISKITRIISEEKKSDRFQKVNDLNYEWRCLDVALQASVSDYDFFTKAASLEVNEEILSIIKTKYMSNEHESHRIRAK